MVTTGHGAQERGLDIGDLLDSVRSIQWSRSGIAREN